MRAKPSSFVQLFSQPREAVSSPKRANDAESSPNRAYARQTIFIRETVFTAVQRIDISRARLCALLVNYFHSHNYLQNRATQDHLKRAPMRTKLSSFVQPSSQQRDAMSSRERAYAR